MSIRARMLYLVLLSAYYISTAIAEWDKIQCFDRSNGTVSTLPDCIRALEQIPSGAIPFPSNLCVYQATFTQAPA
ncbi:hypothetical protein MMC30_002725 [Trapelia coarctata]|nr:hypothetical protein [Trapelia coarctata]